MCGIAGYWGEGTQEILEGMEKSLNHRGPDDGGTSLQDHIGLAHRRLSILDLSPTGHQPMSTPDGMLTVVFNGEIYNYRELKETYLKSYTFRGTSDTEVLLYLYKELGESFLEKLQGMFALALYDKGKEKLLLARDPFGKKPLYYTLNQGTFIFGSELKALRKHPQCPRTVSTQAMAQYLFYEYIPSPATIYEDIFKLAPGTLLSYDGKKSTIRRYSTITSRVNASTLDFESSKQELKRLLQAGVEKRLVADVPVGVFLSGGLDSSTVAYFAQQGRDTKIKTFSIGFKDASFDESDYARDVAAFLGTEHREYVVDAEELKRVIPRIPQILDEPMADSSIIPTLILSEFASKEVKVVLGGDGADELFWGYDTFYAHRVGEVYEKLPPFLQKSAQALGNTLPVSHAYMSFDFKVKKFLSGFGIEKKRRNALWLSAFSPEELRTLLTFEISPNTLLAFSDEQYASDVHFWDALQHEYIYGYLSEDILVKTDRAAMAHGLEVRAPFLDREVVDFAMTLPQDFKLKGRTGKYIVREMMRSSLPSQILARKKKGFNIPIGSWIRNDLKELFTTTILDGPLIHSGLFNRGALVSLLETHMEGKTDNRKKIWALFVMALWMEE